MNCRTDLWVCPLSKTTYSRKGAKNAKVSHQVTGLLYVLCAFARVIRYSSRPLLSYYLFYRLHYAYSPPMFSRQSKLSKQSARIMQALVLAWSDPGHQAACVCSPSVLINRPVAEMLILRGFISSGISSSRLICRRPFSILASETLM